MSANIVQEILRDREAGSRRLVSEYRDRLYAVAFALCKDPAEAEDLVFRTFEQVLDKIGQCRSEDTFYAWMCSILRNFHSLSVRSPVTRNTAPIGGEDDLAKLTPPVAADGVVNAVDSEIVRQSIEAMPPKMREVLILHYFLGQPVAQMARTLMLSKGTVLSRLHYARLALATRLGAQLKKPAVALIAAALFLLTAAAAVIVGVTASADSDDSATGGPRFVAAADSSASGGPRFVAAADSSASGGPRFVAAADSSASGGPRFVAAATSSPATSAPVQDLSQQQEKPMKLSIRKKLGTMAALIVSALAPAAVADETDPYVFSPNGDGANGACVNTGYYMKPTTRIEVDFQYPVAPTRYILFGAWRSDARLCTAFWTDSGTFKFILADDKLDSRPTNLAPDAKRHTAVIDVPNHRCWLQDADGQPEHTPINFPACQNTAAWPVVLFGNARNAAGDGEQHVSARIYSVKIYETENGAETLVHDLVPCQKGRDAGFYDAQTGRFLYGRGATELVCGGEDVKTIPDDAYLQSSGSQSFDTGYCMNPKSRIEVDYQYPSAPSGNFLFGAWSNQSGYGLSALFWNNAGYYSFVLKDNGYAEARSTVVCADTNRFMAVIDVPSNVCQIVRNGYVRFDKSPASAGTTTSRFPVALFGGYTSNKGTIGNLVSARIYSAKIYERADDGTYTLKMCFLPYAKEDDYGFMETESGTFTALSGISCGGTMSGRTDAYVENDGATVLNLGYTANMKSRIEVDYQCLNLSGDKVMFGAWNRGALQYCCWNKSGTVTFNFGGKNSGLQTSSGLAADKKRHTAVMDMYNRSLAYVTDGVTNTVSVNAAADFNKTDEAGDPMGVFAGINNGGTSMVSTSRIYAVRIYETEDDGQETLVHEFLPYTDGTVVTLWDARTGQTATRLKETMAWPTIGGMGVDGAERWLVAPTDATVGHARPVTLTAAAVGAVSYKWTMNGVLLDETDGELDVSWRKSRVVDVYTVTPVYNVLGVTREGAPRAVEVTHDPVGTTILFR